MHPNTWLHGDVRNFDMEGVMGGGDVDGTLRRYMIVDDTQLLRAPAHMSNVEASADLAAGVTA